MAAALEIERGTKRHRLTAVKMVRKLREDGGSSPGLIVDCECGNRYVILRKQFGRIKSCGCLRVDLGRQNTTHGHTREGGRPRLYTIWSNMRRRCETETNVNYNNWGGRGIQVCEERHDYQTFHDWAKANGYAPRKTLDRIDNDGDYRPDNCRWTTPKVQARNARHNVEVTAFGETKLIIEWSEDERCKVPYGTLYHRLYYYNWEPEKAISTPSKIPRT